MTEPTFEEFPKVERFNQPVTITEKIHGTNAQIFIGEDGIVMAGSRNRWLTCEEDNFGFAAFVTDRKDEIRAKLGPGRHYGEWYGLGINAGYALKEKRFALFNTYIWQDKPLPERFDVVPVVYAGPFTPTAVDESLEQLKTNGSLVSPGYTYPEGIVIRFDRTGVLMKKTFEQEDVAWARRREVAPKRDRSEVEAIIAPFWQPLRLEKLLSRDQKFGHEYPSSLPALVSEYLKDLQAETDGVDDATWKLVRKHAFPAVKEMMVEVLWRACEGDGR